LHVGANVPIAFCQWLTGNPGDTMLWLPITENGTYCAVITTYSGCSSTACITVDSLNPVQGDIIAGHVIINDTIAAANANVHAFAMSNNSGHPYEEKAVTQIDQQGYYSIKGLDPGLYLIKVDFNDGTPESFNYLPTYHLSSTTWDAADPVVLPDVFNVTTDIRLKGKTGHNGSGVIGGVVVDPNHIVAEVNEDSRNLVGLSHVEVLLSDVNGDPLDAILTDELGNFQFTDLAFGTYRLKYDIAGLPSPEIWVTLTISEPEKTQITIIAENGASSVKELDSESVRLYPNPAKEEINVALPGGSSTYDVQVIDMEGRVVYAGSARNYNGILRLDVSRYADGLYHVNLIHENHRYYGRFIKQE
jgi:hypothetical protein